MLLSYLVCLQSNMSLLTTTSLIVVWCTLEVVNSQVLIPQPPIVNQQYVLPQPQEASSYPANAGYQINTTYPGIQDGSGDSNQKEEKKPPYKMFYIEKDQFRCEECDGNGNIRGNMTYLDGSAQKIRTVKYETKDIPLNPNAQEEAANPAQPGFSGAQEGYPQPQLVQGQQFQPVQGQQVIQGQPLVQGQQLQVMGQPQPAYQIQPIQAQGPIYQGSQAVFGPLNNDRTNYPLMQQQNPITPQVPVPLIASQNVQGAVQSPRNFVSNPYASSSPSFPFALEKPLPEAISSGIFGPRSIENAASVPSSQGTNGYPSMEVLAAQAIRNLQPQPTQSPVPTIQPLISSQQQPGQPQVLNDNSFSNLARRFNFINSNGVDDKPQGPSILSSPAYQQPLFSPTGTGVTFNLGQNGDYNFRYKTIDSSRQEVADSKNNVVGNYAFRDPSGGIHSMDYTSGADGFRVREQSVPGAQAPSVMPAMILVPTQQQGSVIGQQLPFALIAAGNPQISSTSTDQADKSLPKDEESAKPSETEFTEMMLQKLAKQIVDKIGAEKSGAVDGTASPQATGEGDQPTEAR